MITDSTIRVAPAIARVLDRAREGHLPTSADAALLADCGDVDRLMDAAATLRDEGHGDVVSYSRKVFIPLTKLCRDACHYCTFAQPPRRGQRRVSDAATKCWPSRAPGERAGCKEALFTLGDKPELRYRAARDELARLGHDTHALVSRARWRHWCCRRPGFCRI